MSEGFVVKDKYGISDIREKTDVARVRRGRGYAGHPGI
jgi:hypothetical protein